MPMKGEPSSKNWFLVENAGKVETPALLVYPDRVEENIRRMVKMCGSAEKLRPHIKTHKLAQIIERQIVAGIKKLKAATIAEAEIAARSGAVEVLLAYQPVGPNARRFVKLVSQFPRTTFACLVDDLEAARNLSHHAAQRKVKAAVMLDVDCGQHRTGVMPDQKAVDFYRELCRLPGLYPAGLHAYDCHLHSRDAS